MTERPILFKGWGVKAILDDTKTMTRRLRGLATVNAAPNEWRLVATGWDPPNNDVTTYWLFAHARSPATFRVRCPYGVPGDRLWVRETWRQYGHWWTLKDKQVWVPYKGDGARAVYTATEPDVPDDLAYYGFWRGRPSIHLPRKLSRLTLEVLDVRVERVQEISGEDCIREGVTTLTWLNQRCSKHDPRPFHVQNADLARDQFRDPWDSINAKRGFGWDVNPWVWAVTFRRLKP